MEDLQNTKDGRLNKVLEMFQNVIKETTKTKVCADIIVTCFEVIKNDLKQLFENKVEKERQEVVLDRYFSTLKLVVSANYKAQKMLNPNINMPSEEEQYLEELERPQVIKLREKYPDYFSNKKM